MVEYFCAFEISLRVWISHEQHTGPRPASAYRARPDLSWLNIVPSRDSVIRFRKVPRELKNSRPTRLFQITKYCLLTFHHKWMSECPLFRSFAQPPNNYILSLSPKMAFIVSKTWRFSCVRPASTPLSKQLVSWCQHHPIFATPFNLHFPSFFFMDQNVFQKLTDDELYFWSSFSFSREMHQGFVEYRYFGLICWIT